jgi:hypothetical protein
LAAGKHRLIDAQLAGLSVDGKFSLGYGAAHMLSLAALRWRA